MIAAVRGVRKMLRGITNRFLPGPLVLLYHRVADLPNDPFELCVTPRAFSEHLEVLRSVAEPLRLGDVTHALRDGNVRKGVALTFDDGYADNLLVAKPLLERHEVPATFFIATGYVDSGREFWWDELERIVFRTGPDRLTSADAGGGAAGGSQEREQDFSEAERRWHRGWKFSSDSSPHSRHRRFRLLYSRFQAMAPTERDSNLRRLRENADVEAGARPEYRVMCSDELVRLTDSPLVEIGAHSVNHPLLTALEPAAQSLEIRGSKDWLERTLGRQVASFSYPHGGFSSETVSLIAKAGFDYSFGTRRALASSRSHPLAIPRVVPEGLDGDAFARFLREWLP